jgi:hypothetical protein
VQSIADAVGNLVWSVTWMLAGPTIVLLLLKRFVPVVGDPRWRAYCRLLGWLVVAPVRLIRLLVREAIGRRHR